MHKTLRYIQAASIVKIIYWAQFDIRNRKEIPLIMYYSGWGNGNRKRLQTKIVDTLTMDAIVYFEIWIS